MHIITNLETFRRCVSCGVAEKLRRARNFLASKLGERSFLQGIILPDDHGSLYTW